MVRNRRKRYSARVEPSAERSVDLLTRRIAALESTSGKDSLMNAGLGRRDPLIAEFAWVMSGHTETFMRFEAGSGAMINPAVADDIVGTSRLLQEIAEREPSLVTGTLRADRQHWTAIRHDGERADASRSAPRPSRFILPSVAPTRRPTVKPVDMGLYTSTATSGGTSMWREYLEPFRESTLYPLPWYVWQLEVMGAGVTVAEIVSARMWVEFVEEYSRARDGLVYPDWGRIADDFDAVHLTLPLITAAQGFYLRSKGGVIPPAFWDVETTFWLRWCFPAAHLVETVDAVVK
jgi:hypothetical protein